MSELPKSLRVGYREFEVQNWDRKDATANERYGQIDKNHAVIKVCEDYGRMKAANTLLHEVLHAAYDLGNLTDDASEEMIVTVLANQLTQIWRDNPDFVAFMSESLSPPA